MRVLEAKDFLVQQTAEQAALENVPLSDLEKRMMYFSETDECPENPIALNDEFEAKYDTDEYEARISKLMHHAYQRIKKENSEDRRRWDDAIRKLRKGDHYVLVLWDQGPKERPPYDQLKLLGTGILLAAALVGLAFLAPHYGASSGGTSRGGYVAPSGTHTLMPLWLQRLFWFLIVAAYLYYVILPWILKKPSPELSSLFLRLLRRDRRSNSGN